MTGPAWRRSSREPAVDESDGGEAAAITCGAVPWSYTHPDVLGRGVAEGWADPITDPAEINWAERQANAAIPFTVVNGRPVNPVEATAIPWGRNELGHWGEGLAADALVTLTDAGGHRRVLMVEREDGHGWALPGGGVEEGETPPAAAVRELAEETGLLLHDARWHVSAPRYVPDPRASREAWMVTVLCKTDLGAVEEIPPVAGGDDAVRAAWIRADSYDVLRIHLTAMGGEVFRAHVDMLRAAL